MKKFILLISLFLFGCLSDINIKEMQYSDIDTKQSFKEKLRQYILAGRYTIVHLDYTLDENDMLLKLGGEHGVVFYQNFDSDLAEEKQEYKGQGNKFFDNDNYLSFATQFSQVGEKNSGRNILYSNALLSDDSRVSYDLRTQTLNNTDWNHLASLEDEHWLYVEEKNWDDSNYPTKVLNQTGLDIYHLVQVFSNIKPNLN